MGILDDEFILLDCELPIAQTPMWCPLLGYTLATCCLMRLAQLTVLAPCHREPDAGEVAAKLHSALLQASQVALSLIDRAQLLQMVNTLPAAALTIALTRDQVCNNTMRYLSPDMYCTVL